MASPTGGPSGVDDGPRLDEGRFSEAPVSLEPHYTGAPVTTPRDEASGEAEVVASAPTPASLRPLSEAPLDDVVIWSLVEAAPDGIVLADEDGKILLVNRQTEQLFGYDRGELLGRFVEQLLPERVRSVHRTHRTRYGAQSRVRPMGAGLQLRGRRSDGTEFPVEVSLSPVRTDDGLRVVAAIRDITDRVEGEARAEEIREILDATRDCMSIFDAATLRFTYVNQGLVDQIGYHRDELLDMTMLHIAPELNEARLGELLAPLEEGDDPGETFATLYRRRDGTDVPVEILLQAIIGDDGRPRAYVTIARDITERLEAEERRRRTEQELRVLQDRERMARDLHDLVIQRLFATGMAAQSIISRIDDPLLAARVTGIVDEVDKAISEIRTVIFGLRHHIGTDDGGLRARILTVVEEERSALGFSPQVHFFGPIESTPDDIAQHVLAILREALSNIARHAHASTVDVSVEVDTHFVLRVADNGIGLGQAPRQGNGLRNMAERAHALGGTFDTLAGPDGATTVECRIPLPVEIDPQRGGDVPS